MSWDQISGSCSELILMSPPSMQSGHARPVAGSTDGERGRTIPSQSGEGAQTYLFSPFAPGPGVGRVPPDRAAYPPKPGVDREYLADSSLGSLQDQETYWSLGAKRWCQTLAAPMRLVSSPSEARANSVFSKGTNPQL